MKHDKTATHFFAHFWSSMVARSKPLYIAQHKVEDVTFLRYERIVDARLRLPVVSVWSMTRGLYVVSGSLGTTSSTASARLWYGSREGLVKHTVMEALRCRKSVHT